MKIRLTGTVAATVAFLHLLALAAVIAPATAFANGLVSHRAIYDMELGDAKEAAGIASLSGRMVYEFTGNACEGYTVSFRFVTEFQDESGGTQVTDLRSSTFEDPKAATFQFVSKTYVDHKLVEQTRGSAQTGTAAKTVELQAPEQRRFDIAGTTLFPTEHLNRIIHAARAGKRFLAVEVFDGSETGDKVYATTAVIGAGRHEPVPVSDAPSAPPSAIAAAEAWPVTIAYFEPAQANGGEQTPAYQLSFLLYENGISRQITMDYGEFSIKGRLKQLELLDDTPCTN